METKKKKKAGVVIFISHKKDFKTKPMKRDKVHCIMIKGLIKEEDITIIYICIQHRSTTICKAKANKYERIN